MGKFERVSGAIRVSGRYQFASGCDHAEWAILGGHLANASTGEPEHCLAILHKSDYQIVDTWYAMGLKGSGSKDIVVENALVPEYRVEFMGALLTGKSAGVGLHPGTLYRIPYSAMIGRGFSVVVVGAADGLVQVYTDRQRDRTSSITGLKAIDAMPSYMRLAVSADELYAATLMLEKDWERICCVRRRQAGINAQYIGGLAHQSGFCGKACRQSDRPPVRGFGRHRRLPEKRSATLLARRSHGGQPLLRRLRPRRANPRTPFDGPAAGPFAHLGHEHVRPRWAPLALHRLHCINTK